MQKAAVVGILLGAGLVGYKASVYCALAYQLKKAKKQKVVSLGTISEYKKRLEEEKEK